MYSGFTSIRMRCCITVLILSGYFWCSITQGAEETAASWRVVILHSSDIALPASVLLEQTARKTLLAGTTRRIESTLNRLMVFACRTQNTNQHSSNFFERTTKIANQTSS